MVLWTQVWVLLNKDWILHKRNVKSTLISLLFPLVTVLLGNFGFLSSNNVKILPFTTYERSVRPVVGPESTYIFDPFPNVCLEPANIPGVVDLDKIKKDAAVDTPIFVPAEKYWHNSTYNQPFDCFVDAVSLTVAPLWRKMVNMVRRHPVGSLGDLPGDIIKNRLSPVAPTLALGPGKQRDRTTLGGQLEAYLLERFFMKPDISLWLVAQGCFRFHAKQQRKKLESASWEEKNKAVENCIGGPVFTSRRQSSELLPEMELRYTKSPEPPVQQATVHFLYF